MAELLDLRAICTIGRSSRAGRNNSEFTLLEQNGLGILEAMSAIGLLAHRGINGLRIAARPARAGAKVAFLDGIADTDVHRDLLRAIRKKVTANKSQ